LQLVHKNPLNDQVQRQIDSDAAHCLCEPS